MSLVPSIINNGESSSVIRGSSSGGNHPAGTVINNGESSSAIRGSSSGGNHLAGKKAATTRQRGNKSKQKYDTCSTSIPLLYQRSSVQGIFQRK